MKRPGGVTGAPERIRLAVRIKPNARRDAFEADDGTGRLKVSIRALPVDGKANRALIGFLAKAFGVSKSQVSIVAGAGSRDKIVEVRAPAAMPACVRVFVKR